MSLASLLIKKQKEFISLISNCDNKQTLQRIKNDILDCFKNLFAKIINLENEEKKVEGKKLNEVKEKILEILKAKYQKFDLKQKGIELREDLSREVEINSTKLHPISAMINRVCKIFQGMNFQVVKTPEIESEKINFDALNIDIEHPARNKKDTFYLKNSKLLRTHTSNIQGNYMSKIQNQGIITVGRVYRKDYYDSTHSPVFHQIDGIYLHDQTKLGHLKWCINSFISQLIGETKLRFRTSFFPFTEPSFELDIYKQEWIEVLGAGMIHNEVLKRCKAKNKRGFAFGIGIERLVMIQNKIDDLRLLYENDINTLRSKGSSCFK